MLDDGLLDELGQDELQSEAEKPLAELARGHHPLDLTSHVDPLKMVRVCHQLPSLGNWQHELPELSMAPQPLLRTFPAGPELGVGLSSPRKLDTPINDYNLYDVAMSLHFVAR